MADIASVPITVTTGTTPPKPGWQTSEFWGAWAAKLFGALLTSGLLADGSMAMRITGAAVFVLAQLGYTWSRTAVKTAVLLLAIGLMSPAQLACTAAQRTTAETDAKAALINCTGQAIGTTPALDLATLAAITNAVTAERAKCTPDGGSLSWSCVETDLLAEGKTLGGCTFVKLVLDAAATTRVALLPMPTTPPGRAELEEFRSRVGGGSWHTASGDL